MAIELAAEKRNVLGKKVKNLRQEGFVPAELYGHEVENVHLTVSAKDLIKALKESGESSIINLNISGDKRPVLTYNIQRHPVKENIIAVDFYQVRLDEKVETTVPIELVGESPAVKEKDGVLLQVIRELNIEALPTDIPRSINVDISSLIEIDQTIYIKDLNIGKGVKILAELEAVVVTVQAKMTEDEAKAMEEKSADISEVKVESEEKKKAEVEAGVETPAVEEKKKEKKE